jgi:predicted phage terminase large subunit-like protein
MKPINANLRKELKALKEQELFLKTQELYKKDLFKLARLCGFKDLGECHKEICGQIEESEKRIRRLFLLPRGHYKTTLIGICNTVRDILINPNIRILFASSTIENVKLSIKVMKNIFLLNPDFRKVFPEFCPPETTTEWGTQMDFTVPNKSDLTKRENTVEGAGVGKTIIGRHYDKIVLSDIVTPDSVNTPEQIKKTKDWVKFSVSLLDQPGKNPIVMEGTRYDFDDVHGDWEKLCKNDKRKTYFMYKHTAETIKEGKRISYFPERFPLKELDTIKIEQGSWIYASQYMLDPIDEGTAPFKREQIRYIERIRLPNPRPPYFMAIDPAISESKNADYFVITTATFDENNMMYVVGMQYGHWNINSALRRIIATYKHYKPIAIAIETVSFQKMLAKVLYELSKEQGIILPIKELPRDPHVTKQMRIMSLQPRFEQRRIKFCEDLDHEFIENQILRYTPDKKHNKDDLLDTLADLDEIKLLPKRHTKSDYENFPMLRYVEWLYKTDKGEDERFEDYDKGGQFVERAYYTHDHY